MPAFRYLVLFVILSLIVVLYPKPVGAQYFGRNKVQYDNFSFRTFPTEHFEIHFYPAEEEAARDAARMAERWYERHRATFGREFDERKPIVLYANDADFRQTTVIRGSIGQGTGGVTEPVKERVVMPLTGSYAETDHVLGHELVHSFQFDLAFNSQDSLHFDLNRLPLWLVEGMAEYLSVGREDAHTAMWLRDAVLRDDLPTLENLTEEPNTYFPYRYGQAVMAYVGGKYGDATVATLFERSGHIGVDSAIVQTMQITPDSLSKEWAANVRKAYLPLMEERTPPDSAGRRVLAEDIDAGSMNLSPSISPDGNWVAFLSERDLFSIELFVADAKTGEIVSKLGSIAANPHLDALRFINSAGSWSPEGQKFAFIAFANGDNEIAIVDWTTGKIERRISVRTVTAMTNPAWSPDGRQIAFSGLKGGISDLYLLDLETEEVRQLTDDRYADLQPAWSPDGRILAFATDRGPEGTDFETLDYAPLRLGLIDVANGRIRTVAPFRAARHHNPQFSPDGRSLYFISDRDGFSDVYRYELETTDLFRVTKLKTGVSGVTALSPAMSVASQSGRMMFSVFSDDTYTVFSRENEEAQGTPVSRGPAGRVTASLLPPWNAADQGLVENYIDQPGLGLPEPIRDFDSQKYDPKLGLDYVAPPTIGVSAGGTFGTRFTGGVGFFFSDMLGYNNLGVVVQANGTFKDIGGQVAYLNRRRRFNYGASAGHIPLAYSSAFVEVVEDPRTGSPVRRVNREIRRIFLDEVDLDGIYPLSTTRRLELSAGFVRYGFDYEIQRYTFLPGGIQQDSENLDNLEPDPLYLVQSAAAYVTDYSFFGFTSPVRGGRYRLQATPFLGSGSYVQALADYRHYFFLDPVTVAVRALHVGNYGAQSDDVFASEYLGYPNGLSYIRGYSFRSFRPGECSSASEGGCAEFDRLQGTRIAMASAELRVPLLGNDQFGLIPFRYLPTELALFADAGLAWTANEPPVLKLSTDDPGRIPVFSLGVATRFNIFGALVLEVFYAYPFQRPIRGGHFGVQFVPGW